MSYEGHEEYIDEDGLYYKRPDFGYNLPPDFISPYTKQKANLKFYHRIDVTNGYEEGNPDTCEAPKRDIGFYDQWNEDHYGNRYAVKLPRFLPGNHWDRMEK